MLGGGGTLGEAWLRSLLAGLEAARGWDLRTCDAFVGTSAGSIVASVLAAGRRPEAADGVAAAWEAAAAGAEPGPTRSAGRGSARAWGSRRGSPAGSRRRRRRSSPRASPPAARPSARRSSVVGGGARATSRSCAAALAQLPGGFDGRLRVAAVELRSGRRVVFGAPGAPPASVADAVLASCAVPWVFRPVTIGGREYVDGGAWSAANLDAAPVERGTEVLCLNPTASPRLAADRLGAVRAFAGATAASEALVLRARGAGVRIVAPDAAAVAAIGPNLFDSRRRRAVEAAGYTQGRAL